MPTPMEIWNSYKIEEMEAGGGGGGGSDVLEVHGTIARIPDPGEEYLDISNLDKTFDEMKAADNSVLIITQGTSTFRLNFQWKNNSYVNYAMMYDVDCCWRARIAVNTAKLASIAFEHQEL